jgi:hypothetical protein
MYRFLHAAGFLLLALAARGQITETPVTVQPGRFLLEVDALSLTIDREPGLKYTAFGAASTFLTTGITRNLDLQVGAELYLTQKFDAAGFTERTSGIGDVYVRAKYRFYESNDTYTAVAVLPYVKIPTNSGGVGNDSVEGGVIVPMQTQLIGGFDFAAMVELAMLRNAANDGHDGHWFASAYLSRQLFGKIGLYGEAALAKSTGGEPWEGTVGFGATLAVTENAWWDFAVYRGVSSGAADWNQVIRFNLGF